MIAATLPMAAPPGAPSATPAAGAPDIFATLLAAAPLTATPGAEPSGPAPTAIKAAPDGAAVGMPLPAEPSSEVPAEAAAAVPAAPATAPAPSPVRTPTPLLRRSREGGNPALAPTMLAARADPTEAASVVPAMSAPPQDRLAAPKAPTAEPSCDGQPAEPARPASDETAEPGPRLRGSDEGSVVAIPPPTDPSLRPIPPTPRVGIAPAGTPLPVRAALVEAPSSPSARATKSEGTAFGGSDDPAGSIPTNDIISPAPIAQAQPIAPQASVDPATALLALVGSTPAAIPVTRPAVSASSARVTPRAMLAALPTSAPLPLAASPNAAPRPSAAPALAFALPPIEIADAVEPTEPDEPAPLAPLAPQAPAIATPGAAVAPALPAVADLAAAAQLDLAAGNQWLDQLTHDITRAADTNGDLRFQLAPPNLGRLHVAIAMQADGAAIRLTTETAEAQRILREAQPVLVAEARAQGLRVAETHVDLTPDGGGTGYSHNPQQQADGRQPRAPQTQPLPQRMPAPAEERAGADVTPDDHLYA